MRKINKLGKRAAALVLAVGLTLSTAAPVLAAGADEVQTPAAQTEQQDADTDTEADEADVDTEADEAAALPELSEDREVAEEDEAAALPELSEDREVAEEDEAVALPELSEDREAAGADEDWAADEAALLKGHKHSWKKEKTVAPTCTEQGYTLYKCAYNLFGVGCTATKKDDFVPALDHNMSDWIVVAATCTTAGEKYKVCQRSGCNHKVVEEGYAEAHPALDHDFEGAEWVIEAPTCTTPGQRYQVCKRDGCNQKNIDEAYAEAHPALGHVWGKYVDDDKPGCQDQTESQYCTVCGARNVDSETKTSGPVRKKHKFTHYEATDGVKVDGKWILITEMTAYCDYGCGEKDVVKTKDFGSGAEIAEIKGIDAAADSLADTVTNKINDALKKTEEAARNAETKEKAVDSLDTIYNETLAAIMGVKIGNYGVIDETTAKNLLSGLKDTMDSVKDTLNDSFLSKDSVQNSVSAIVSAATGEEGTAATKKSAYELLFSQARGALNKEDGTDADPIINNLVLKLAQAAASDNNKEAIDDLTDSLVDDALDLAMDEIMKDEKYAKLLKTKLGAETMDEVRKEIRRQLVEDTSFMDTVRKQVEKAASDASTGVSAGWDDRKVLDRMQANLLPISDMVSSKITELGNGAGTIVDKKVDDTVHKFLPGKLGDWVSDKVGNKVNNIVQNKVNDLGGQVTDLIDSFIKQFTCGKHEYGDFEILKNPTCTEKGQKGKICKKCGKITEKTDIDAAGHAPVTDPAVAPTETTDGLTEGSHCSVCGAVLTAQEVIPMRDPTIDTWFSRAATTEADAKAAGFDSVDAANAALDAALTAAGFDPANAEHFTVQVNSSIGVLPNDRFSESGVTGKLTLPEGTRGKTAQTYYVVQMFTADTRFHKAGDVVVTPVSIDTYAKTGLQFTVYSEAVMAIAWKAQ